MKTLTALAIRFMIPIVLSLYSAISFAQQSTGKQEWRPLLTGSNTIFFACTKDANQDVYKVSFRHTFPGYARIALTVREKGIDGTSRLHTFNANGLGNRMYGYADNTLPVTLESNSIESLTVQYMAYGISYGIYFNLVEGTKEFTMEGKGYTYGLQYTLNMKALPMLNADQYRDSQQSTAQPVVSIH